MVTSEFTKKMWQVKRKSVRKLLGIVKNVNIAHIFNNIKIKGGTLGEDRWNILGYPRVG